jgi:hypothetical protein
MSPLEIVSAVSAEFLEQQLNLSDDLRAWRLVMLEPQDLPGRYGRAIRAIDHVLQAMKCEAVLGGGWAVWRHGYAERLTQDLDIALPVRRIDEFLRVAAVSGFEILPQPAGRWPKLRHVESGIQVDILPEGARPGTQLHPAPTAIPAPAAMGAAGFKVSYIQLNSLIELKIAAGRRKDLADVVALLKGNLEHIASLRQHLASVHPQYAAIFDQLVQSAQDEDER